MRRPQTKTPYSYHQTATRKRGRPVHRVYAATPRPPMTGESLWFFDNPEPYGGHNYVFLTKDHNHWWVRGQCDYAQWLAMKGSPTQGRLWNAFFWEKAIAVETQWSTMFVAGLGLGETLVSTEIGPCPYTPDDSFIF